MAARNTKKTVFFIVEGNTDKTALEKIFKKIYRHKDIRFAFTDGDITSDETVSKENVCDIIYGKVKSYMDDKKLKKSDIWMIVQIFDTDGTYIPESAIMKGESKGFAYSPTYISCKDVQKVKDRNERKADMMNYLLSLPDIKGIPYKGYYMSSNLDHALYNEQNLTEDEKKMYADAFYSMFNEHEKLFIDFLEMRETEED